MNKIKKIARVGKECVACGTCLKACNFNAIEISKGIRAEISDACVACGKCKMVCPCCVITMEERGGENE